MQISQLSLYNESASFGWTSRATRPPRTVVSDPLGEAARVPDARTPGRLRKLLDRFDEWFWAHRQRDIEAYLARSTDVCDLERRIRALERNSFQPYY